MDRRRSRGGALAERHPGIAASAGVFVAALCAFLAIGAALPVLPVFVRGPLHGAVLRADVGYDAVWVFAAAMPFAGALLAMRLPEPAGEAVLKQPSPLALLPRAARRPGIALALANIGYAALAGFVILDLSA